MATTPVLNQYGGGIGTNGGVPQTGAFNMPGMSNSGMLPIGGSGQNPTGTMGGSTTGSGVPMVKPQAVGTNVNTGGGAPVSGIPTPTPAAPVTGMQPTATGENGQTITNNTQTQRQTDRTLGELQSYYGEGVGSYLYNLLNTGGINENVANQTNAADINAMQESINQGSANLNSTLGAQGVSANSSTNALANSQYQQGATAQENAVINQNYMSEYMQGQQMLESILPGIAKTNQEGTANEPSVLDEVLGGIGAVTGLSSVVGSVSSLFSGLRGGGGASAASGGGGDFGGDF